MRKELSDFQKCALLDTAYQKLQGNTYTDWEFRLECKQDDGNIIIDKGKSKLEFYKASDFKSLYYIDSVIYINDIEQGRKIKKEIEFYSAVKEYLNIDLDSIWNDLKYLMKEECYRNIKGFVYNNESSPWIIMELNTDDLDFFSIIKTPRLEYYFHNNSCFSFMEIRSNKEDSEIFLFQTGPELPEHESKISHENLERYGEYD